MFRNYVLLLLYFKNKNSLRTIEAQIVQKLKNNEARSKFTGSYKKKGVYCIEMPLKFMLIDGDITSGNDWKL